MKKIAGLTILQPEWSAPPRVHALTTTRLGGTACSSPYGDFNLATHVGDDPAVVGQNRQRLRTSLNLPNEPVWLNQIHSNNIIKLPVSHNTALPHDADGAYTSTPNVVCAVLTADCLPILLCHHTGNRIAAIHAGWRGLANGILEQAIKSLDIQKPNQWLAWIGPSIGPHAYEVGLDVYTHFTQDHPESEQAFIPGKTAHHFYANLPLLARQKFLSLGISQIYGGQWCTYQDSTHFYSYRREGKTGRMATLIWFEK